MLLLVAVAVLVVAAVAVGIIVLGGGDDPDPGSEAAPSTPPPTAPEAWDPRVAPIAAWVAGERGLAFEHPVAVTFLTPEEYAEKATGDAEEDAEEEAEVEEAVALLRALGLVHGEVELDEEVETLMGEGSLAYYTAEDQEVFVRGTELTPAVRVTLAHELTHVLQDQHFDLERLGDPDFERGAVLRALAEGDAGRIEDAYAEEELTDEERQAYEDENDAAAGEAQTALEDIAPALVALFVAPYALGEGFVGYLEATEGEDALDAALRDPPSEQELLDPTVRGTERADEVEVDVEVPSGAEVIDEDVFGPVAWYLLLSSRGDPADALVALDGWGGDAFVSYREDDEMCARAVVTGDDLAATDLLHIRLTAWAAADPAGGAVVTRSGDLIELDSCDPGADAAPVGEVDPEILGVPAFRTELVSMLEDSGLSAADASCAANRLIARFSIEELTGDPAEEDLAELQREVQGVVSSCV